MRKSDAAHHAVESQIVQLHLKNLKLGSDLKTLTYGTDGLHHASPTRRLHPSQETGGGCQLGPKTEHTAFSEPSLSLVRTEEYKHNDDKARLPRSQLVNREFPCRVDFRWPL